MEKSTNLKISNNENFFVNDLTDKIPSHSNRRHTAPRGGATKKKRPPLPEICNILNEDLKDIHHSPHEIILAFNFMFSRLKLEEPQEFATIYYILLNLFENRQFNTATVSPTFNIFLEIAQNCKIFYRSDAKLSKFKNIRDEFLKKGIIARVLYTKNYKKSGRFFPVNPTTLWNEISSNFSDEDKKISENYRQIIQNFEEKIYNKKFGLGSNLLNDNYNILTFHTKWMIYLLLTYAKPNSKLSLQLSKMRSEKEKNETQKEKNSVYKADNNKIEGGSGKSEIKNEIYYNEKMKMGNFYKTLLDRKVTVNVIIDLREKEDVENAMELKEKYKPYLNIKYTYEELKGTSRRIILENLFAADAIKILPDSTTQKEISSFNSEIPYSLIPSNNNALTNKTSEIETSQRDTSYVGILYADNHIKKFEDSFESWWKQAIPSEEIESAILGIPKNKI